MEIIVALMPMLTWGSIGLVSGKIGGDANQQTLGMTMGAFIFSLAVFFITGPSITWWVILIGFITGIFWSIGQNGQFHAMKYMGVSIALPLSTGFQLIVNTIAGAILFHEWQKNSDFLFGFLSLALLVFGSYLTARQDKYEKDLDSTGKIIDFSRGFKSLVYSTIGYGLYTIIVTWASLDPMAVILPQSVGMLAGASYFAFRKTKISTYIWKNSASGILWGIGNICMLLTIQTLGLAVSFSLSQMGIIISTLGGIFILGEHKSKKELVYVISGCLLVIAGGLLLGYMKSI